MKETETLKQALESLGADFELVRELGRGATAVVYLLRDHALDRDVAMKVIRTSFGANDEAIARLQREARLVAKLQHPNIVKLYESRRLPDGSLALLMEHVPGRNLKEVVNDEGALPVDRALTVLMDVASALAYAHRRKIVHRDVKPENVYLDEEVGTARLADFGVARPWDQDTRLTLPGESLGTPAYMSPEQIDGKDVDGRSDVYSLGLVGYEVLLGRHPWEGENLFNVIFKQKNEDLPSLATLGLGVSPALAGALEKAVRKEPDGRWESAEAFLNRLVAISDDTGAATGGGEGWTPSEAAESETDAVFPVPTTDDDLPWGTSPAKPMTVPGRRRWVVPLLLIAGVALGGFGAYKWLLANGGGPEVDPFGDEEIAGTPSTEAVGTGAALPLGPPTFEMAGNLELAGPIGSALTLAVRMANGAGDPVADTLVNFQVLEGEGFLAPEEGVRTDSTGTAQVVLWLPAAPGPVQVQADVPGSDLPAVVFDALARAGPPTTVRAIQGGGQTASTGASLPQALGIRVFDEGGNPVPDVDVRFRILDGGGRVNPSRLQTDSLGQAFARWTLGSQGGPQTVAALVPAADEALLTFTATALAPAPVTLEDEPEEPLPPVRVVQKTHTVGGSQVCRVADGVPRCRGANDRGQAGTGALSGLLSLSAGLNHLCGIDATGVAACWGANESGQLGDGTRGDRTAAAPVATDLRFSLLAAGASHTCGLSAGGKPACWGRNINGQLGDGTRQDRLDPRPSAGNLSLVNLVAGWNHTCGVDGGGRAYCWGLNASGQLGDGTRLDRLVPTRVPGAFQSLVAGNGHTCGISGGDVLCWGDNTAGQLGDGTTNNRTSPTAIDGLPGPVTRLAAGAQHTCALLRGGSVYCWGQNLHGQLGDGSTQNRSSPVAVAGDLSFRTLEAGGGVTCGISSLGQEYCWGLNRVGQLGDGSRTNRSTPVRVGG